MIVVARAEVGGTCSRNGRAFDPLSSLNLSSAVLLFVCFQPRRTYTLFESSMHI